MNKFYLFSGNVSQVVKMSMTLAISLLLITCAQIAKGHESSYTHTGTTAPGMLNTTVNVGVGQTFTSLTGAGGLFAAINTLAISGDILATITSDINESGAILLNPFVGSLKIQSDGTMRTLLGTNTPAGLALICINGADNVTFDGGTGKLLTFKNFATIANSNTGPVIQFLNGSISCEIKNCNLQGNSLRSIGMITIGAGFNSIAITNCDIRNVPDFVGSPRIGIYSNSSGNIINITNNNICNWGAYGVDLDMIGNGCTISGNSFFMEAGIVGSDSQTAINVNGNNMSNSHTITGNFIGGQQANCGGGAWSNIGNSEFTGITLSNITSPASIIQGNTIQNILLSGSGSLTGIQMEGENTIVNGSVLVRKNKIFNIGALSPLAWVYGIRNTQASGINEFSNNMIAIGGGSALVCGFQDNSSAGSSNLFFNSINIYGITSGTNYSYAFYHNGASTCMLKNNIFSNVRSGGLGNHFAISNTTLTGLISDYNDFYASGTVLANWCGTPKADITAWRAGTFMDAHSVSVLPGFTSSDNLHVLNNASLAVCGTPVSVLDDIDGLVRGVTPGIGINQFSATVTTGTPLTVTGVTANKVYDGTTSATFDTRNAVLNGKNAGDVVTLTALSGAFTDKNAGTGKSVAITTYTLGGTDAAKYTLGTTTLTADIAPKPLNIVPNSLSKDFEAEEVFTGNEFTPEGLVGNDHVTGVTITSNGAALTAAPGTYDITASNAVGVGLSNYAINYPKGTLTVKSILATPLTVTGVTANKVYDGTTTATFDTRNAVLTGKNAGDVVTLTALSGAFTDKNAGTGKNIAITGFTLGGTDAAKYTLGTTTLTADIAPKPLNIVPNSLSKDFEAEEVFTGNEFTPEGLVGNDHVTGVTITSNGAALTAAPGTYDITASNAVGVGLSNYAINYPKGTLTVKNPLPTALTFTGVTADKMYDGTIAATFNMSGVVLAGIKTGDVVTLTGLTGTFTDKNAGTGKNIAITAYMLGGPDATKYTLGTTSLTSNITSKALTITANSISKCLGATPTFIGTEFTPAGLVGNDAVTGVTLTSNGTLVGATLGTYDIVASNAVGTGLSNYSINYVKGTLTVNPFANQPADFALSTASVCKGASTIVYRVPNDPLVTYRWSYSGTGATINGTSNSVTLDFSPTATSGTLSVTASTTCGTSIARPFAITVYDAPPTPVIKVDSVFQVTMTSSSTTGNQWYDVNGLITGATNQTYTATRNGSYYVKVTGNCSTVQSNTVSVTHVSVLEFEKPFVSVYPNPDTGEFWVKFKAPGNEKLKMIQVYNSLGKAVYQTTPSTVTNDLIEWVSIKHQPVGVYILVLTTDNQKINRQIVITK